MNLDEKIIRLREVVMTEARAEGNAIIENHKKALETLFDKHKQEVEARSQLRIKSETTKAKRQLNQATAKAQVEMKREMGKCQEELKTRLFGEVKELLEEYRSTPDYTEYLCKKIREAITFADGEEIIIYITPADQDKKEELERRTGMSITISEYPFLGGVRSVIRGRNILIDQSFQASLEAKYKQFQFGI